MFAVTRSDGSEVPVYFEIFMYFILVGFASLAVVGLLSILLPVFKGRKK